MQIKYPADKCWFCNQPTSISLGRNINVACCKDIKCYSNYHYNLDIVKNAIVTVRFDIKKYFFTINNNLDSHYKIGTTIAENYEWKYHVPQMLEINQNNYIRIINKLNKLQMFI